MDLSLLGLATVLRHTEARVQGRPGRQDFLKQACYVNSFLYTCPLPHQFSCLCMGPLGQLFYEILRPLKQMALSIVFLSFLSQVSPGFEEMKQPALESVVILHEKSELYPVASERPDGGQMWDSLRPQDTHQAVLLAAAPTKPYQPTCGAHLKELTSKTDQRPSEIFHHLSSP